jgi:hypothetical protein
MRQSDRARFELSHRRLPPFLPFFTEGHYSGGNWRCSAFSNWADFEEFGAPRQVKMTTTFTP